MLLYKVILSEQLTNWLFPSIHRLFILSQVKEYIKSQWLFKKHSPLLFYLLYCFCFCFCFQIIIKMVSLFSVGIIENTRSLLFYFKDHILDTVRMKQLLIVYLINRNKDNDSLGIFQISEDDVIVLVWSKR